MSKIIMDVPELPKAERDYIKCKLIKKALYLLDDEDDPVFYMSTKDIAERMLIDEYFAAWHRGDISSDELTRIVQYIGAIAYTLYDM